MASILQHQAKTRGVHGIPNVNELANLSDNLGKHMIAPTGVAFTSMGNIPAMAIGSATGAVNADDAYGTWWKCVTTSSSGNANGWQSTFALVRASHIPIVTARIKVDTITSLRLWFGLFSADASASDTPAISMAAIHYSSAISPNFRTTTKDGTTQNNTTPGSGGVPGVPLLAAISYTLCVEAEGVPGLAPTAYNFYINRALISRHTTNLPANPTVANLGIGLRITNLAASARQLSVGAIGYATQG